MSEQRRSVRIAKPIEVEYSANSPPIRARLHDLSENGMFLDTQHRLAIGSVLQFRLDLPDRDGAPIVGTGRVAWVDPLVGVGVEFVDLEEGQRERLRMFVASVFFGVE